MAGVAGRDRLLFYYTLASKLPALVEDEQLPTDPSLTRGLTGFVTGRGRLGLVWLSDNADLLPEQLRGTAQVRPGVRGRAGEMVRVTVAVSGAQRWPSWARRHRVSRSRVDSIDDAAGGSSGRWWVLPRPIPTSAWVRIDTATGENLWPVPQQREIGQAASNSSALMSSVYRRADENWPTRAATPSPQPAAE